jgi:glycosyltransferase involved in cell wall biosynthesis
VRRLKILYVIGTLDVGGTERQLVELVTRLDRARFDPVVLCLASGDELVDRLRNAGVRVEIIGLRKPAKRTGPLVGHVLDIPGRVARFFRNVRVERPDIVHGMLFWAYTFAAFAARLAHVPVVIASRRSLSNFKRGKRHYVWLERAANGMTDLFVANSMAVKNDVLSSEGVAPGRVRVIYNGIDPALYESLPREALRDALVPGAGSRVAIVVANFISYKGHPVFLEAWRRVLDAWPDAVALLVGDGPTRTECEALAARLSLGESVRFLGTRHDVANLLGVSAIAVHPSFEEGFSNAILEAMAAGLPLVATAVGGNAEAVEEGVNGHLIPPRDPRAMFEAIADLFGDPARARRMGDAGRRRIVERFSMSVTVREYESLYEELGARAIAAAR